MKFNTLTFQFSALLIGYLFSFVLIWLLYGGVRGSVLFLFAFILSTLVFSLIIYRCCKKIDFLVLRNEALTNKSRMATNAIKELCTQLNVPDTLFKDVKTETLKSDPKKAEAL